MYFVIFIYYYFLDYVTSELGLGKEPDLTNIDSVMFMFTLTWVDLFFLTLPYQLVCQVVPRACLSMPSRM